MDFRPKALSEWLIRSDLAYVGTALNKGPSSALLALPHGVLVGFEATTFLTTQLSDFSAPEWDKRTAAAARHRAKLLSTTLEN